MSHELLAPFITPAELIQVYPAAGEMNELLLEKVCLAASEFIEEKCERSFLRGHKTEERPGTAGLYLRLRYWPVWGVDTLTINGTVIEPVDAIVQDSETGLVFRASGWGGNPGYKMPVQPLLSPYFGRVPLYPFDNPPHGPSGLALVSLVSIGYDGGFDTVPAMVWEATLARAAWSLQRATKAGIASERIGDYSYSMEKGGGTGMNGQPSRMPWDDCVDTYRTTVGDE